MWVWWFICSLLWMFWRLSAGTLIWLTYDTRIKYHILKIETLSLSIIFICLLILFQGNNKLLSYSCVTISLQWLLRGSPWDRPARGVRRDPAMSPPWAPRVLCRCRDGCSNSTSVIKQNKHWVLFIWWNKKVPLYFSFNIFWDLPFPD